MKKTIMKKWVKALRSGEYDQAQNKLVKEDDQGNTSFCCLGVLCNLAVEAGHGEWRGDGFVGDVSEHEVHLLPDSVREWSGIETCNGRARDTSLATLNDTGRSFSEIADFIEENYKEL